MARAAVDATYDAPLGIITEARWISDYFHRLSGRDAGLAVHLHFTPTYSFWLNQVEVWFARIERDVIARGVFACVPDLQRKLIRYIHQYNKAPKTIKWSATRHGASFPFQPLQTTLMSAFPSSRRVNSWLSFKRLFWAVPGKAGGTAVMTTVDHTLMCGSKPHDR